MYSFDTRVRYSETNADLELSMVGLVKYLQDVTIFDSERGSANMACLQQQHLVWLLGAWQIVIERMPKLNEEIKITTLPYEFKGFMGLRNFIVETMKGEVLAKANSVWSLINTETGRPQRPSEMILAAYELSEKIDMEYKPRKISAQGDARVLDGFQVLLTQIDSNHHMNNAEYVNLAVSCLPEHAQIREMRVEYKTSAYLGDVIVPYVYEQQEDGMQKMQIQLCGANKEDSSKLDTYAVIEFSYT